MSVVIDEAQFVANGSVIEQLLQTGRKHGAHVSLATQAPSALGETLPAVLTNANTIALFRLSAREAALFADRAGDIAECAPRLRRYHAALIRADSPPVVMRAAPPLPNDDRGRERARKESLARFRVSAVAVDPLDAEDGVESDEDEDVDLEELLDGPDDRGPTYYRLTLVLAPEGAGRASEIRSPALSAA